MGSNVSILPEQVKEWSVEQVGTAVASIGTAFDVHAERFTREGVDGQELLRMKSTDLLRLGVKSGLQQRVLQMRLKAIVDSSRTFKKSGSAMRSAAQPIPMRPQPQVLQQWSFHNSPATRPSSTPATASHPAGEMGSLVPKRPAMSGPSSNRGLSLKSVASGIRSENRFRKKASAAGTQVRKLLSTVFRVLRSDLDELTGSAAGVGHAVDTAHAARGAVPVMRELHGLCLIAANRHEMLDHPATIRALATILARPPSIPPAPSTSIHGPPLNKIELLREAEYERLRIAPLQERLNVEARGWAAGLLTQLAVQVSGVEAIAEYQHHNHAGPQTPAQEKNDLLEQQQRQPIASLLAQLLEDATHAMEDGTMNVIFKQQLCAQQRQRERAMGQARTRYTHGSTAAAGVDDKGERADERWQWQAVVHALESACFAIVNACSHPLTHLHMPEHVKAVRNNGRRVDDAQAVVVAQICRAGCVPRLLHLIRAAATFHVDTDADEVADSSDDNDDDFDGFSLGSASSSSSSSHRVAAATAAIAAATTTQPQASRATLHVRSRLTRHAARALLALTSATFTTADADVGSKLANLTSKAGELSSKPGTLKKKKPKLIKTTTVGGFNAMAQSTAVKIAEIEVQEEAEKPNFVPTLTVTSRLLQFPGAVSLLLQLVRGGGALGGNSSAGASAFAVTGSAGGGGVGGGMGAGHDLAQAHACGCVANICLTQEGRQSVCAIQGLDVLVDRLRRGPRQRATCQIQLQEASAMCLQHLALALANPLVTTRGKKQAKEAAGELEEREARKRRQTMLQLGAVPLLVDLAVNGSFKARAHAVGALAALAIDPVLSKALSAPLDGSDVRKKQQADMRKKQQQQERQRNYSSCYTPARTFYADHGQFVEKKKKYAVYQRSQQPYTNPFSESQYTTRTNPLTPHSNTAARAAPHAVPNRQPARELAIQNLHAHLRTTSQSQKETTTGIMHKAHLQKPREEESTPSTSPRVSPSFSGLQGLLFCLKEDQTSPTRPKSQQPQQFEKYQHLHHGRHQRDEHRTEQQHYQHLRRAWAACAINSICSHPALHAKVLHALEANGGEGISSMVAACYFSGRHPGTIAVDEDLNLSGSSGSGGTNSSRSNASGTTQDATNQNWMRLVRAMRVEWAVAAVMNLSGSDFTKDAESTAEATPAHAHSSHHHHADAQDHDHDHDHDHDRIQRLLIESGAVQALTAACCKGPSPCTRLLAVAALSCLAGGGVLGRTAAAISGAGDGDGDGAAAAIAAAVANEGTRAIQATRGVTRATETIDGTVSISISTIGTGTGTGNRSKSGRRSRSKTSAGNVWATVYLNEFVQATHTIEGVRFRHSDHPSRMYGQQAVAKKESRDLFLVESAQAAHAVDADGADGARSASGNGVHGMVAVLHWALNSGLVGDGSSAGSRNSGKVPNDDGIGEEFAATTAVGAVQLACLGFAAAAVTLDAVTAVRDAGGVVGLVSVLQTTVLHWRRSSVRIVDCALRALCTILQTLDDSSAHLKPQNRSSSEAEATSDAGRGGRQEDGSHDCMDALVGCLRDMSRAGIAPLLAQLLMLGSTTARKMAKQVMMQIFSLAVRARVTGEAASRRARQVLQDDSDSLTHGLDYSNDDDKGLLLTWALVLGFLTQVREKYADTLPKDDNGGQEDGEDGEEGERGGGDEDAGNNEFGLPISVIQVVNERVWADAVLSRFAEKIKAVQGRERQLLDMPEEVTAYCWGSSTQATESMQNATQNQNDDPAYAVACSWQPLAFVRASCHTARHQQQLTWSRAEVSPLLDRTSGDIS